MAAAAGPSPVCCSATAATAVAFILSGCGSRRMSAAFGILAVRPEAAAVAGVAQRQAGSSQRRDWRAGLAIVGWG